MQMTKKSPQRQSKTKKTEVQNNTSSRQSQKGLQRGTRMVERVGLILAYSKRVDRQNKPRQTKKTAEIIKQTQAKLN
jgi:hypothetical protein